MRSFDNLRQLCQYIKYCPVCQKDSRDINVSLNKSTLLSFDIGENNLQIISSINRKKSFNPKVISQDKFNIELNLGLDSNNYSMDISEFIVPNLSPMTSDKNLEEEERQISREWVKKTISYFNLHARCKCKASIVSKNINVNSVDRKAAPIEISKESIYIPLNKGIYHISVSHESNQTFIDKYEESFLFNFANKTFTCAITDFDFSNLDKTINKIKTILTFS